MGNHARCLCAVWAGHVKADCDVCGCPRGVARVVREGAFGGSAYEQKKGWRAKNRDILWITGAIAPYAGVER